MRLIDSKRSALAVLVLCLAGAANAGDETAEARIAKLVDQNKVQILTFSKSCRSSYEGWLNTRITTSGLEVVCYVSRFNKIAMGDVAVDKDYYAIAPDALQKAGFNVLQNEDAANGPWFYLTGKRFAHLIDLSRAQAEEPLNAIVSKDIFSAAVTRLLRAAAETERAGASEALSQRIRELGKSFKPD